MNWQLQADRSPEKTCTSGTYEAPALWSCGRCASPCGSRASPSSHRPVDQPLLSHSCCDWVQLCLPADCSACSSRVCSLETCPARSSTWLASCWIIPVRCATCSPTSVSNLATRACASTAASAAFGAAAAGTAVEAGAGSPGAAGPGAPGGGAACSAFHQLSSAWLCRMQNSSGGNSVWGWVSTERRGVTFWAYEFLGSISIASPGPSLGLQAPDLLTVVCAFWARPRPYIGTPVAHRQREHQTVPHDCSARSRQ